MTAETQEFKAVGVEKRGWTLPTASWYVLACLAIIAAVSLRFAGLGDRDIWVDESCTFYVVHHFADFPSDGPVPQKELAHIPYFVLLKGWTMILGESAGALRGFSAFAGTLAVLAIGLVAHQLGGRWVGLLALLLAAVHPLHIHYSQEARVYAFWSLEITVCAYFLFRASRSLQWRWWVIFGFSVWLTVLTHYYTLFWIPASVAVVAASRNRNACFRRWLITILLLGVALVPVVWLLIWPLGEGGPKPWLRETWLGYPPLLAVFKSVWALLPSGAYPKYLGQLPTAAAVVGTHGINILEHIARWSGACALTGASVLALWHRYNPKTTDPSACPAEKNGASKIRGPILLWLALHTLGFLGTAWAYSYFVTPLYIVGRYDLAAWPTVTIALALLICSVGRRFDASKSLVGKGFRNGNANLRIALACLCLAGSSLTILGARLLPVARSAAWQAKRIAANVQDNDLVISVGMYRWFMSYEWHQLNFAPNVISFPLAHDRQLCWDNPEAELTDKQTLESDISMVLSRIDEALVQDRRVWLLIQGDPQSQRWQVDKLLLDRLRQENLAMLDGDSQVGLLEIVQN